VKIDHPLKIIFFGSPQFALPALRALIKGEDKIVGVVTQPDRPRGRGKVVSPTPVKAFALENGLKVFQPLKARGKSFIEKMAEIDPDLLAVVAYGQILPQGLLDIPRFGAINVHASLLPKYRGAAPIQWAIICGERQTGITTIKMEAGLDTGDILVQSKVAVKEDDTAKSLHDRLAEEGSRVLMETISRLKEGSLKPIPQNHSQATYAPVLKREHGIIDWSNEARIICNWIRGLDPWLGCFTTWEGKTIKVFGCAPIENDAPESPGEIVEITPHGLKVATGKGYVLLRELQLEGSRRMTVSEFILGHDITVGEILGSDVVKPIPREAV